jgi:predicted porin
MKKSLIALAALAAVTAASAQSTVVISGTFGSAYQSYETGAVAEVANTSTTVGGSLGSAAVAAKTNKGISPVTDASVKFTATEDLGGGLKAIAAGQFAMNNSRGGAVTKEDSSVTLAGNFGSVAFVSTRSSDTAIAANVFASWMPITSFYATVSARVSIDTLGYTTPSISGFTFSVTQAELTEAAVTSANKVNILGASYTNGPLTVMAAQKSTTGAIASTAKKNNTELAATYDFGIAKVGLGYDGATTTGAAKYTDSNMTSFGVSVPLGAVTVGLNGAKRGANKFYDAGVNYDLSKRTSVRLAYGDLTGTSSSTANWTGKQYRVGLLHTF